MTVGDHDHDHDHDQDPHNDDHDRDPESDHGHGHDPESDRDHDHRHGHDDDPDPDHGKDHDHGRAPKPGRPRDEDPPSLAHSALARQTPHLDDLYREVVLDHYRNPRGRKKLADANVTAEGFNPTCGDQVRVALNVRGDRVEDVEVDCQGCSISVASGSMMAELLRGKNEEDVERLTESFKSMMHGREPEPGMDLGDLEALEGVRQFPVRIKCALLAWTTLQEALAAFRKKSSES